MEIVRRSADLHALVNEECARRRRVGLVPTMGNLHAGHYSLVALARERCDVVITSIFVNPTQFGPNEDFARYPRTPDADAAGLEASGCDVLFLPPVEEIYPYGISDTVRVEVPGLSDVLEGAIRPGHFAGVATVVAKLFNLVRPHVAVFGRKDFQQLLVIRRMAIDLGYPIDIVAAPIVREANGLAMSSRNQYLDAEQRRVAAVIHATLVWMARTMVDGGRVAAVDAEARNRLQKAGLAVDYAVIRNADDLSDPAGGDRDLVALIAARSGSTRLIDNLLLGL